ncbi:hypothetical protein MD484_g2811, partial [Candolleomyces efflorescens]
MHDDEEKVVVFWDASASPATGVSGFELARSIQAAARTLGEIKSFKFYVDVNGTSRGSYLQFRSDLKFAGVTVVDTVSEGREGSPAKALLTDTFVYALDNPAPQKVLLVSGDPDLCYAISLLRLRGYDVYLIGPSGTNGNLSHFHGNLEFNDLLFAEDERTPSPPKSPPINDGTPGRPRSGATGPPARATSGTSSSNHCVFDESSNLLAPSEIEEFRQRYSTNKPDLNATNPEFTPRRLSFGGGSHPALPSWGNGSQAGGIAQTAQKGKGKAPQDSPIHSPGISPASSTGSESHSFDSYVMPPSVSTAPTSALPFHPPDSKAGDSKYQALLYSALRPPVPISATATQQVERTVSEESTDSGIATIIPSRPASVAPPIPLRPITPTPPAPERIQVRASLPSGTPRHTPPFVPPQIPASVMSASRPRLSPPASQTAGAVMSAPQPRQATTPTVLVAPLAPNTPRQTPIVPPAAVVSTPVAQTTTTTTALRATAPAFTSANTSSNSLDGVAPHFQHLIHVLREFRSQGISLVERGGNLFPLLQKRDRHFLVAAGTAQFRNPFVLYLEDAHAAGIITSPTGRVQLAPRYC